MNARAHLWITGRVVGVYFRYATRDEAIARNITGWVRNLRDGRVEAIFEGDVHAVREMIEFCRRGPPNARVDSVEEKEETYQGEFDRFDIRY